MSQESYEILAILGTIVFVIIVMLIIILWPSKNKGVPKMENPPRPRNPPSLNFSVQAANSAIPIQGVPPQITRGKAIGRFKGHLHTVRGLITTGYRIIVVGIADIKVYEKAFKDIEHLTITPSYNELKKDMIVGYYFEIKKPEPPHKVHNPPSFCTRCNKWVKIPQKSRIKEKCQCNKPLFK